MNIKPVILSATVCLVMAAAAFGGLETDIVGKWSDPDNIVTTEYKSDGSFIETFVGGGVEKGRFSFPDAANIKLEFEAPMSAAGSFISAITINGDEMDLTSIDGKFVTHFKRQK
jgi:hypothetical protein